MDMSQAKAKRDGRLRKRLLRMLSISRGAPLGGLSGRSLSDLVNHGAMDQRPEGDQHVTALLRDLVGWELVAESSTRKRRDDGAGLEWSMYRITSKGQALVDEQIPVVPGVDDERNLED